MSDEKSSKMTLSIAEADYDDDFYEEEEMVVQKKRPQKPQKQKKVKREKTDSERKSKTGLLIILVFIIVAAVLAAGYFYLQWKNAEKQVKTVTAKLKTEEKKATETATSYRNYMIWQAVENAGLRNRLGKATKANTAMKSYIDVKSVEAKIDDYLQKQKDEITPDIRDVNDAIKALAEKNSQKISFSKGKNTGVLSKQNSIVRCDGHIEVYYSSTYYRHRYVKLFRLDANGVYRDRKGFVAVASSDLPFGSFVTTSHGVGRVYDTNSTEGVISLYVNW